MDIHEFIYEATKMDSHCIACFDLSKNLEEAKKELEKDKLQREAMNSDLILCYTQ